MFTGITDDSRKVKKGYVFVAVKGLSLDGHDFIPQAIENGASKIYGELDLNYPNYYKVTDSRQKLGELASEFFGNPSEKLVVIGVTGTKGKTTTVHIIHHILNFVGKKAGLISTISVPGYHVTTPDVIELQESLSKMVNDGCKYAVVEVSSHGIDQKRIAGVKFEVGVLTNISAEHLDYHKTFKEYKKVKMSFLKSAKIQVVSPKFTNIDLLPGKFNNINAETAVSVCEKLGVDRKEALKALKSFQLPEGRLEEIKNDKGFRIFIDFAHTPESLFEALSYLREITDGKLISVFGCAGERDKRKRSKMGKISSDIADISVFTAEDPRSENIFDILRAMKKYAKNYFAIPERGEAINYALSIAKKGDTVAIFGKGHEKTMSYKGYEHPWSDSGVINNFLSKYNSLSAIILAAGKGTRMKSSSPKVLHEICGRPMLSYTIQHLRSSGVGDIVVVVSYRRNQVIKATQGAVKFGVQKNPKGGTADSVSAGLPMVSNEARNVMVLYGDDTAFYSPETIKSLINEHSKSGSVLTFVTLIKKDPHGLGRILRGENGKLIGIVEEKDATEDQRKIKEINDGMYIFSKKWLIKNLPNVVKSPVTGEYYIVELIKMAIDQGQKTSVFRLSSDSEWQGINTPEELEIARKKMEKSLRQK